jgi:hypothetical protein
MVTSCTTDFSTQQVYVVSQECIFVFYKFLFKTFGNSPDSPRTNLSLPPICRINYQDFITEKNVFTARYGVNVYVQFTRMLVLD